MLISDWSSDVCSSDLPGMPRPTFTRSLLSPRHWPAWLGVSVIWLIARLPQRALMWMGRRLGAQVLRIPSGRRRIAEANIALCFPELDRSEEHTSELQ